MGQPNYNIMLNSLKNQNNINLMVIDKTAENQTFETEKSNSPYPDSRLGSHELRFRALNSFNKIE